MNATTINGMELAAVSKTQHEMQTLDEHQLSMVSGGASISSGLANVGFSSTSGLAAGAIAGVVWGARTGTLVGVAVGALVGVGYVLATSGGGGRTRLFTYNR